MTDNLSGPAMTDSISYIDADKKECEWFRCGRKLVARSLVPGHEPLPPESVPVIPETRTLEWNAVSWEVQGWVNEIELCPKTLADILPDLEAAQSDLKAAQAEIQKLRTRLADALELIKGRRAFDSVWGALVTKAIATIEAKG